MKSARWRDFNALRRAHVSVQVTRRVVAPKSNITYNGNCSTKGGRTIHALSNFDHDFRDHKSCILKKIEGRCVRFCLNFISQSITAGRCDSRKLYVHKHPGPWTGNLENHEIFQNIDAGEGFMLRNS